MFLDTNDKNNTQKACRQNKYFIKTSNKQLNLSYILIN